jgi:hypothetical protein
MAKINQMTSCLGVSVQAVGFDHWQAITWDGWKSQHTMSRDHAINMGSAHRKVCMKRAVRKRCF